MDAEMTTLAVEITGAKEEIYRSLAILNDALKLAVEHTGKLKAAGALPARLAEIYCAGARHMKSSISHAVGNRMSTLELEEAARFEKLRLDLEREVRELHPPGKTENGIHTDSRAEGKDGSLSGQDPAAAD